MIAPAAAGRPANVGPPRPGDGAQILLFSPTFNDGGGVARMFVNLANGLDALGVGVRLLARRSRSVFLDQLQPGVRRGQLRGGNDRALAAELCEHLRAARPLVVLSGQPRDDAIALAAKRSLHDPAVRFFSAVGTSLPEQARLSRRLPLTAALLRRRFRRVLSGFDGILVNSRGAAAELVGSLGIDPDRVSVVPLPSVTADLSRLAAEPVDHPWLAGAAVPLVLAVGRLTRVKDYPTLLRAFALLHTRRRCRLIILGEGRQRPKLERLVQRLGLSGDAELPGFTTNPYAYMARAGVLVVSSLREGGPQVLIEALALGTPVVSTDCPSGPREILDGGRYGRLVPRRSPEALAEAMAATLDDPPAPDRLAEGAARYRVDESSRAHLEAFGLR
ncbi:MAG: glycosyltransferase [Chromatiales bacterium]|jgi:glycosyltransferase involved in cell wall biosynthesis